MTTSKPARVRLDILIDATDERLCGKGCPRKTKHGECDAFHGIGSYTLLNECDTYEGGARVHKGWWRSPECRSATKAVERDEAIVAAAIAWAADGPTDWNFASDRDLFNSVDAKRAHEAKEPK